MLRIDNKRLLALISKYHGIGVLLGNWQRNTGQSAQHLAQQGADNDTNARNVRRFGCVISIFPAMLAGAFLVHGFKASASWQVPSLLILTLVTWASLVISLTTNKDPSPGAAIEDRLFIVCFTRLLDALGKTPEEFFEGHESLWKAWVDELLYRKAANIREYKCEILGMRAPPWQQRAFDLLYRACRDLGLTHRDHSAYMAGPGGVA